MELSSYFRDLLADIRLTPDQVKDLKSGHTTLRERLNADEGLAPLYVGDFLQGSYRRATAVRPNSEGAKPDVDVIVVTNLDRAVTSPDNALERFHPFLEKHYKGKWGPNGRSLWVELPMVKLDLVVTSAPSEADKEALSRDAVRGDETLEDVMDWRLTPSWVGLDRRAKGSSFKLLEAAAREEEYKLNPLYIPDRDAQEWKPTHPLEQIRWTQGKNARCNTHYVNVVKALKWWRMEDRDGEYPKGYPLEHIIGVCCPDSITSVAAGVTRTLEAIRDTYQSYVDARLVPPMKDHGVEHDVFARITAPEFAAFHARAVRAAAIAREALDATDEGRSASAWQKLFGGRFPDGPDSGRDEGGPGGPGGGFTPRKEVSKITGGRFA